MTRAVWDKVMFSLVFVCPRRGWGGVGGGGEGGVVDTPVDPEADPPVEMATEESGTHPTGMYSCKNIKLKLLSNFRPPTKFR